jgi:hypothetical protein
MESLNETSKKFPGMCRINVRPKKNKWVVKDESELIKVLRDENEYDRVVTQVETIKKTELKELLDTWQKIGKIPDCVETENTDDKIISITSLSKSDTQNNMAVNTEPLSMDDMDTLDS